MSDTGALDRALIGSSLIFPETALIKFGNRETITKSGPTITYAGLTLANSVSGVAYQVRVRSTIAALNAAGGVTILAAQTGLKYRLVDFTMIAYGGAAGGATGVLLRGTQAASVVSLASVTVGALTQSTVVKPNTANATVLADGASFVACDSGAAITFIKNGSDLTTATGIDLILTYALEV